MSVVLHTDSTGSVRCTELPDGRRRVSVDLALPVPGVLREVTTEAPRDLIRLICEVKTAAWAADELSRAEPGGELASELQRILCAFVAHEDVEHGVILDFGCGSGASLIHLARLFPGCQRIIGLEFQPEFLEIAARRIALLGDPRVCLLAQDDPLSLPVLPAAKLVVLSAVVEHMLPAERSALLPRLWQAVGAGGFLFVSDTPHRWFPVEAHTTRMWWLNYQSDSKAFRRVRQQGWSYMPKTWEGLLRAGIRGSTERELLGYLTAGGEGAPRIVAPRFPRPRRRADLWHEGLTRGRRAGLKIAAREVLHLGQLLTGSLLTQNVTLCVQKHEPVTV